ncbi:heparan-alpha-glucosaminide N-acetyltransferase domain-containing protein [Empedobacter brevis]|uniref:heparan-alpha-glucosaminide N-acetyltransferase domain-containing protein n=1 Tax=Empedobacter brevis TaxID=247 RepID=UPI0023F2218E|nr:heparan-alpha-glucosaminide N-acetyltransferase domain-containing protein [Empedobacter brevis]
MTDCAIKKERFIPIDVIKTIAVFIMIFIHVLIMYASEATILSNFSKWLLFILEGIGAPAFIFCMGVSIVLSDKKNAATILKRGIKLFITGYILNILKFYPTIKLLQVFPEAFFTDTNRLNDTEGLIGFLLIGDILQFAAIAYIICSFIMPYIRLFPYLGIILCISIFIIAPQLYHYENSSYLLSFIYGKSHQVYFPLFPWIGFSFLGLSIGIWIENLKLKQKISYLFLFLTVVGVILFISGFHSFDYSINQYFSTDYYHRTTGILIMYSGELLLLLSLIYFVSYKLSKEALRFFVFCSKNVTNIYIIQWILIYWGWYFVSYRSQSWDTLSLCFMIITALTFSLSYLKKIIHFN